MIDLEYKTCPELLQVLEEAAGREMTRAEVREQKVSFVAGMVWGLPRDEIERLVDRQGGI